MAAFAVFQAAAPAQANEKYAAIVVDANSGKVLFSEDANAQRYPASLTKMMTLYVLFEELDAGRFSLKTKLSVSTAASRQAPSKLGLKAGSTIRVEDAILALVTKSANDAAWVVAENVSGSVTAFAERMTRTAHALGMSRSTFRNPHGLLNTAQKTTAADLVLLARALQDRFPVYYKYFSTPVFAYKGARHRNHNRLLGSVDGVDGIKTGYTRASGFNLVTNVVRGDRHIIAVVLGGKTAASRDAHMRKLIGTYLPKATRSERTVPLLVVTTGEAGRGSQAAEALLADARLPRSRPEGEVEAEAPVMSYAPAAGQDLVSLALAAAEAGDDEDIAEGMADGEAAVEVADSPVTEISEAMPLDPIAQRIADATALADGVDTQGPDPIARLTQIARLRTGHADIVAGASRDGDVGSGDPAGWHIQIGAVPTAADASILLERARLSMGTLLADAEPLTLAVDRDGATLYRARFAGFAGKDEARAVCDQMKRKDISCLAVPN